MSNYRGLLGARTTVPDELERIAGVAEKKAAPAAKKPAAKKK
jgi:hypothetical protein